MSQVRIVRRPPLQATSLALFCAVLLLGGCKSTEAPVSAFTPNPELMTRDARLPFQSTYWNKKYDSNSYTELYVAPVNTQYVMAQSFWEKANIASASPEQAKKDVAMVAEYTRQSFINAAKADLKKRFVVVDKPGPKTLILELAITQLVPSKAVLNAIGYVTWIPGVVATGTAAASGSEDTGKGVIAIEGRIRDGASGEIIGMFADREHPKTAIIDIKALNWWAPARAIIDEWGGQLIAVANMPPGGVVKEAPAFELLVW